MTSIQSGPYEPYVPQLLLNWPESQRHQRVEGSLVHVDISGFTAMSERMAQQGRIGAEEVSAVLNKTFTELLTIAAELGGDLLKFGGDALLLLFTDVGHALRAVRAAAVMRSRLRTVGKVSTPAGRVDLKMTVGVHSGLHDVFLVGDTHRELLVVGPGATETVNVEEEAEAGEILLSHETAAQVPGGLLGERKSSGCALRRIPPPIEYVPPHIFCEEECKIFIPETLRPVVAAPTEGEHRRITVGFIKFIGTDGMLADLGPEGVADVLDRLVTLVQVVTAELGVTFLSSDIDADGGKLIITGGVPTATGSDEERVLRALRRIADDFDGMPLKIGVNYGPAFAGDIGAPFRRTYTVIGDAVNLAARVMGKAGEGDVLATIGVLDRSATLFETVALDPFHVKGKSEPVVAHKIGAVAGRRSDDDADSPLYGRDEELSLVEPYLAGEQSTGLIGICGPSGIGKSRFVRELRSNFTEPLWCFGDCDQYESSTPFYVFRRILREVAGVGGENQPQAVADALEALLRDRAPDLLAWFPLVASAMALPAQETQETAQLGAEFRQAKLHQTVAAFIDAVTDKPTVLVIEDAQWIDQESRDLTEFLAGYATTKSWAMVAVHRPLAKPLDVEGQVPLDLGPIDDENARRLVEDALDDMPLLDHQIADLVDRGGGNPLFLTELAAAIRKGEVLPDNVEALVQARIDRLGRIERQLLRYSSVAGIRFERGLISNALSAEIPQAAGEDIWAKLDEFLVETSAGDLRFRQTLFHDVAYSGISFRVRRRLHGAFGRVLEAQARNRDAQAEVLSLHFLLAGDYEAAWRYSKMAGRQACAKHANVAATRFYERALEAGRHIPIEPVEIARIAESLGDVAEPAGLYEEADRALRKAARLRVGDAGGTARLYRKLGLLRERSGKYPQALRWFTRGLRFVAQPRTDRESLQSAEIELAYAGVRFRQARYADCIERAGRAIEIADGLAERQAVAHGYYLVALARMRSGITRTEGNTKRALAIYEELGDLVGQSNVLNKLGVDAYHAGNWTRAREFYRKSRQAREKAGDSVRAAIITQNEALVLSDQGRLDEAEELFRHVQREFQAAEDHLAIGVARSNIGRILTRRGRFAEGLEVLELALNELREIGAEQFVIDAETRIAENLILAGEVEAGERLIEEVEAKLQATPDERRCQLLRIRAYAALERGDRDEAVRSLQRGTRSARAGGNRYELALQLDALAKVTDDAEVGVEARSLLDRLGIEAVPDLPGSSLTIGRL